MALLEHVKEMPSRPAAGDDHRVWLHRERRGGDEERGSGLHHEAIQQGRDPPRRAQHPEDGGPQAGEPAAARELRGAGDRLPQRRDEGDHAHRGEGGRRAVRGAPPGGKRHGQGGDRARPARRAAVQRSRSEFSVPFVSINCPAVPDTLIESELFGYRKGAFTGAFQNYGGQISLANNGILFLDEIAEIPLKTQAKLLRFIEEKTFEPLGSTARIEGGCPHRLRDEQGPRRHGQGGPVPRRPVLPDQHHHHPHPAAAGKDRRTSCPWRSIFSAHFSATIGKSVRGISPRGPRRAPRLPVAGQRARAAQHHRTGHRPFHARIPCSWKRSRRR